MIAILSFGATRATCQEHESIETIEPLDWAVPDSATLIDTTRTQYFEPAPSNPFNSHLQTPSFEGDRVRLLPQADADMDGLDDAIENQLLRRFRPYFLFSTDGGQEPVRPMHARDYIQLSELLWDGEQEYSIYGVIPRSSLSQRPLELLTANRAGAHWGPSSVLENARKTRYYLNLVDSRCSNRYCTDPALAWTDIIQQGNVGLYGHVSPYGHLIKIEYWQFFSFSTAGYWFGFGNHEGDWCTAAILYDPEDDRITNTYHYAHGKEIAFEMLTARATSAVAREPRMIEHRGPQYSLNYIELDSSNPVTQAQNNLVRFYKAPGESRYEHLVIYIEHGAHEFWPSQHWSFYGAPKHNGLGYRYLTDPPLNLGEVGHHTNEAANLILHYNGRWGAYGNNNGPPPGPPLQSPWLWTEGSSQTYSALRAAGGAEQRVTSWHAGPPIAKVDRAGPIRCASNGRGSILLTSTRSFYRDTEGRRKQPSMYIWSIASLAEPNRRLGLSYSQDVIATVPHGKYLIRLQVRAPWGGANSGTPDVFRELAANDSFVFEVPPPLQRPSIIEGAGLCRPVAGVVRWRKSPNAELHVLRIRLSNASWDSPSFLVATDADSAHYSGLEPGKKYEARVDAIRACASAASEPMRLETDGQRLPPPLLESPSPNASLASDSLHATWSAVDGAASYLLFAECVGSVASWSVFAPGPNATLPLPRGQYMWGVAAIDRCGRVGMRSELRPVSNRPIECGVPLSLEPAADASCVGQRPAFRWTSVPGADRYFVHLARLDCVGEGDAARDPNCVKRLHRDDNSAPDTTWTPEANLIPGQYFWYPIAYCGCDESIGEGKYFTIPPDPCGEGVTSSISAPMNARATIAISEGLGGRHSLSVLVPAAVAGRVSLFDLSGRVVGDWFIEAESASRTVQIDLVARDAGGLQRGVYFARFASPQAGILVRKTVILRS